MANAEHCREVLDYLLTHPDVHDQTSWCQDDEAFLDEEDNLCGTTMCIAGTAAFLSGRMVFRKRFGELSAVCDGVPLMERADGFNSRGEQVADCGEWFEEVGAEYLGLDRSQAHDLFMNMDDDDALHTLKEYANGEH